MTTVDLEKQKQAKAYARLKRRLWLVETAFGALYALLWLLSGWSLALRSWLSGFTGSEWLLVPLYLAIFGGVYAALTLPFNYYGGYALPHRFGQSNQSLKDWVLDQLKGLAIALPIGLLLVELLYLALRSAGGLWWLWAAGGMLLFSVLLGNLAPVLIMPIFNKFIPLEAEHAELVERLTHLAANANTTVQGVFRFDMSRRTQAANAALAGLANTRRIVLGDTLIDNFSYDEIETVLAHELGHHVHRDIPLLIAFGTLTTGAGLFLASLALELAVRWFGFLGVWDAAAFPALALSLGAYSLLTMPLENGFSRWRENLADDYALNVTGKPEALQSAFVRLANQNLGEVEPEPWVVWLFYNHPPLGARIAKARNWKGANS